MIHPAPAAVKPIPGEAEKMAEIHATLNANVEAAILSSIATIRSLQSSITHFQARIADARQGLPTAYTVAEYEALIAENEAAIKDITAGMVRSTQQFAGAYVTPAGLVVA